MDQTAPLPKIGEVTDHPPRHPAHKHFKVPSREVLERVLDGLRNLPAHPATSKG